MPPAAPEFTYRAFLSYSHKDRKSARKWRKRLESFRMDPDRVGKPTALGPVPRSLAPVFHDRVDFPAGAELGPATREKLAQSAALILIASPNAAKSHYVNEEVRTFRHLYPDRPLVVILELPPGTNPTDCFPPALRFALDADGQVTTRERDVLAADPRPGADGLPRATAKVVAGLTGLDSADVLSRVDDLLRRERWWRYGMVAGVVLLLAAGGGGGWTILSDIRQERLEAAQRHKEQVAAAEAARVEAARQAAEQARLAKEEADRAELRARAQAVAAEAARMEAERQAAAIERARQEAEQRAHEEAEANARRHAESMAVQKRMEDLYRALAGEGPAAMAAVAEFRALLQTINPEIATVPVEHLPRLAQSILDNLRKPGADPNDFAGAVREALREAQDRINRLDFAGAAKVLDTELARSEAQARGRSALLAERGRVARLSLRYRDSARFYAQARGAVDGIDDRATLEYALAQASALYAQGDEFGDNPALRDAIAAYGVALGLAPRDLVPQDWATTQNNLGNALWKLGQRERGTARLEEAVTAYRAALEERTRDRVPQDWAVTQNNLGAALKTLGERESGTARLEEAVTAYRAALEGRTRDRVPLAWAMTQNNLGNALQTLGERESGTARLEEAVTAYRAALEERTRDRVPLAWAMTQNNLGNALWTLGGRESGTARLEEAVAAYRAAMEEYTRDRVPLDWAMTQNNLGAALQTLGERESGTARLEQAVAAYRAALEERTRDRVPLDWAMTQNNLGIALQTLGARESGTLASAGAGRMRLEEAVAAYRAALEERTRDRVPLDWAGTQNNLGAALWTLGERESGTARLEEAVAAYRAALEERTRDRVPLNWASTRYNMSIVLALLAERGRDRAALEEAVACARDAVTVFREANITATLPRALQQLGRLEAQLAAWPTP
jgi:hypothetical protein